MRAAYTTRPDSASRSWLHASVAAGDVGSPTEHALVIWALICWSLSAGGTGTPPTHAPGSALHGLTVLSCRGRSSGFHGSGWPGYVSGYGRWLDDGAQGGTRQPIEQAHQDDPRQKPSHEAASINPLSHIVNPTLRRDFPACGKFAAKFVVGGSGPLADRQFDLAIAQPTHSDLVVEQWSDALGRRHGKNRSTTNNTVASPPRSRASCLRR